jgi:hypothetical protein
MLQEKNDRVVPVTSRHKLSIHSLTVFPKPFPIMIVASDPESIRRDVDAVPDKYPVEIHRAVGKDFLNFR